MASELIRTLTGNDLTDAALSGEKALLVDFWAPWCGPCRMMGPVLDKIAAEYEGKLSVGKLNVDENPDAAARFNVQSIPTLLMVKDGEAKARLVGAYPKAALKAEIDKVY